MGEQLTKRHYLFFVIGIIFVSFNLRPSITAVGPLITFIRESTGLSSTAIGLLTTLPVLGFGIFSIIAPKLGRKYSNEVIVFISLLILTIGILLRSTGSITNLFVGTMLLGFGIASCNVLVVGIIKERTPAKMGIMTAIYTMTLSLLASVASGTSIPLATYFDYDWRKSLAVWAIFSAVAIIIWLPQLRYRTKRKNGVNAKKASVWKSAVAWQALFFMGFQSAVFYASIAWLPEIFISQGIDSVTAGFLLTLMQLMGLPGNFLIPLLAVRMQNQRLIVIAIAGLYVLGFSLIYITSHLSVFIFAICLVGLGQGAGLSLALTLFSLRTKTAEMATDLSGMAQSGGYLLAATGPFIIGLLFDLFHTWTTAFLMFGIFTAGLLIFGLLAGRDVYVNE